MVSLRKLHCLGRRFPSGSPPSPFLHTLTTKERRRCRLGTRRCSQHYRDRYCRTSTQGLRGFSSAHALARPQLPWLLWHSVAHDCNGPIASPRHMRFRTTATATAAPHAGERYCWKHCSCREALQLHGSTTGDYCRSARLEAPIAALHNRDCYCSCSAQRRLIASTRLHGWALLQALGHRALGESTLGSTPARIC